ncbi:MAG TPA: tyrosine-type recombinase/integrase [Burkholderiales bacterium]|nr:tyrosine-type recombinase/integrase [Burkholderiales bacterium]
MLEVAPRKSARTYQDNLKEIARLRAVFGHMQPHEVTPPDIYAYMDARGAPVRANREKALLSHVFSYAIRWGVAKDNPCRHVKRNPEKPRERYPEDYEIAAFKTVAGEFLSSYIDLKYMTSMRKGDLLRLRLDSLTDEGISVTHAKTGKRVVYLWNPHLKALVEKIKGMRRPLRSMFLFCTRKGQPYKVSGFDSIWQRTMQKAFYKGLLKERFTEHDIRAKTLTDANTLGQDAQKLAGHKSRAMTDRYVKVRQIERVKPLSR